MGSYSIEDLDCFGTLTEQDRQNYKRNVRIIYGSYILVMIALGMSQYMWC